MICTDSLDWFGTEHSLTSVRPDIGLQGGAQNAATTAATCHHHRYTGGKILTLIAISCMSLIFLRWQCVCSHFFLYLRPRILQSSVRDVISFRHSALSKHFACSPALFQISGNVDSINPREQLRVSYIGMLCMDDEYPIKALLSHILSIHINEARADIRNRQRLEHFPQSFNTQAIIRISLMRLTEQWWRENWDEWRRVFLAKIVQ